MGQGGFLVINNSTSLRLNRGHIHSYQMNSWDSSFPATIEPNSSTGKLYVEFEEGVFKKLSDCGGEVVYAIGDTGEVLNVSVNASNNERCLWGALGGPSTHDLSTDPANSKLGWVHDGSVTLTLRTGKSVTPTDWMKLIDDNTSIARLSIPGTHDSGAMCEPFPGTAKTQDKTLAEQLQLGVRYFDIRCSVSSEGTSLLVFHGDGSYAIYQHLNFDDVLNCFNNFLGAHPSEFLLMRLKNEEGDRHDTFISLFEKYCAGQVDCSTRKSGLFWSNPDATPPTSSRIPTLGEVRGKIVLLQNFNNDANNYTAISRLQYDSTDILLIQDNYEVGSPNSKWVDVSDFLMRKDMDNLNKQSLNRNKLWLNHASGYTKSLVGIPQIPDVANYVNPRLLVYFNSANNQPHGIIAMDFVSEDLSRNIYMKNTWANN